MLPLQKVYLLEKMLEPPCIAVSEESAPKRVRVNKAGCGMFVYCLQCHTSRAKAVAARCEQIAGCRAVYPLRIRHVRKQNRIIDLPVSITPGYLYLFMEKEPLPINQVLRIQGVKNILGEKLDGYQLSGAEKDFALMLLSHNGLLGKIAVRCSGDELTLLPDSFSPLSAEILRVDKRHSTMQIQLSYGAPPFTVWVEYEVEDGMSPKDRKL